MSAVDRADGGGATRINGGIFYGGGGTPAQLEAGVEDSVDDMFNYLRLEIQGVVSDDTLRRFCEESAETAGWLARHGVHFAGRVYDKKTSYPHTDYCIKCAPRNERLTLRRCCALGRAARRPRAY